MIDQRLLRRRRSVVDMAASWPNDNGWHWYCCDECGERFVLRHYPYSATLLHLACPGRVLACRWVDRIPKHATPNECVMGEISPLPTV